jgi:hypothetical protein
MTGVGERLAAAEVKTIGRWAAGLDALHGRIAHRFSRPLRAYERLTCTDEALISAATCRLMARRFARAAPDAFLNQPLAWDDRVGTSNVDRHLLW